MKITRFLLLLSGFLLFACALSAQISDSIWEQLAISETNRVQRIQYYTLAIQQKPLLKYYQGRGHEFHGLNQYLRAIDDFNTVLQSVPADISTRIFRGRSYMAMGRYAEAETDFRMALKGNPNNSSALNHLAEIEIFRKNFNDAVALCKRALQPPADTAAILLTMAEAYLGGGQITSALETLDPVLNLKHNHETEANFVYGEALRQQQKWADAESHLKKAMAGPSKTKACIALAAIKQEKGNFEEAVNYLDTYLYYYPNDKIIQQRREGLAAVLPKESVPPPAYIPPPQKFRYGMAPPKPKPTNPGRGSRFSNQYSRGPMLAWTDLSFDGLVRYQGNQTSCVAFVMASLKEIQENVELKKKLRFSPAFIYNQIRDPNGLCDLENALRELQDNGICQEDKMPYNPNDYKKPRSRKAREEAKRFRIKEYYSIDKDVNLVKQYLQSQNPVIIGVDLKGARGVWTERPDSFHQSRYHALLVVGYDEGKQGFKVLNSWGTNWGEGGYTWIDYREFESRVTEIYVAFDAPTPPEAEKTTPLSASKPQNPNPENPSIPFPTGVPEPDTDTLPAVPVAAKPFSYQGDLWTPVSQAMKPSLPTSMPDMPYVQIFNVQPVFNGFEYLLRIDGFVHIPSGFGYSTNVVVYFFDNRNNRPIGSTNPYFTAFYGQAAVGTPYLLLPPLGVTQRSFYMHIPFSAFNTAIGPSSVFGGKFWFTTPVIGVPYLFVNNIGVAQGNSFPFTVTK